MHLHRRMEYMAKPDCMPQPHHSAYSTLLLQSNLQSRKGQSLGAHLHVQQTTTSQALEILKVE